MKLTFYNLAAIGFVIENITILVVVFYVLFKNKGINIEKYIKTNLEIGKGKEG